MDRPPDLFVRIQRRFGRTRAEVTDDGDPPVYATVEPQYLPGFVERWVTRVVDRRKRRPGGSAS